jgi:hypothetical protein
MPEDKANFDYAPVSFSRRSVNCAIDSMAYRRGLIKNSDSTTDVLPTDIIPNKLGILIYFGVRKVRLLH